MTPVIPEINANTNIVCAQGTVQYTVSTAILLYNTERTIQICWIVEQRLFLKCAYVSYFKQFLRQIPSTVTEDTRLYHGIQVVWGFSKLTRNF